MHAVTAIVVVGSGLFGLAVGSFLNVVIYRVPRKESVVTPRSRCPSCETQLSALDNVPLVSWLVLRGRCRTCRTPISARYPLVELLTGVAFAVMAARLGAVAALPAFLVFTAALIAVSAIDLEHFIIPNAVVYPTLSICVPLLVGAAAVDHRWLPLARAAAGAGIAFGLLLLIHLISPRGMGFGDVRLAAVLGLFLGWLGLGHVFVGLFLAFLLASAVGIGLLATKRRTRKDPVPFGPFLAAGAYLAVLVGHTLLRWYRMR